MEDLVFSYPKVGLRGKGLDISEEDLKMIGLGLEKFGTSSAFSSCEAISDDAVQVLLGLKVNTEELLVASSAGGARCLGSS